jgi:hypothetical protein
MASPNLYRLWALLYVYHAIRVGIKSRDFLSGVALDIKIVVLVE